MHPTISIISVAICAQILDAFRFRYFRCENAVSEKMMSENICVGFAIVWGIANYVCIADEAANTISVSNAPRISPGRASPK